MQEGGVELAAVLAFGGGEHGEEVFEDPAEDVLGAVGGVDELDRADQVDQFPEALLVEIRAAVALVERAFESRVIAFEGDHGVIDQLADARVLGAALELGPAGFEGYPEDIDGAVFIRVFGIVAGCEDGVPLLLEGV
jgi:hypothetical protein